MLERGGFGEIAKANKKNLKENLNEEELLSVETIKQKIAGLRVKYPKVDSVVLENVEKQLIKDYGLYVERKKNLTTEINEHIDKLLKNKFFRALLPVAMATGIALGVMHELPALKEKVQKNETLRIISKSLSYDKETRDLSRKLSLEIGNAATLEIDSCESVESEAEREVLLSKHRPDIKVSDFEKIEVINNTQVREIFESTMPRCFVENISTVTYSHVTKSMPERYGITDSMAVEAGHADRVVRKIGITKGATQLHRSSIANDLFIHESAHLSDWKSNKLLTAKERMNLCYSVIERLKSEDRFKSSYVESIHNSDKQAEMDLKSVEYFAEICSAYFSGDIISLNDADMKIVEDILMKTDKNFDRISAAEARNKIIHIKVHRATEYEGSNSNPRFGTKEESGGGRNK